MVRANSTVVRFAAGLLALVVFVGPASAVADTASVTVFAQVAPAVSAEIAEGGLLVRSNAPWELMLEVADAEGRVRVVGRRGTATGAVGLLVAAEDLIAYSLVLDAGD